MHRDTHYGLPQNIMGYVSLPLGSLMTTLAAPGRRWRRSPLVDGVPPPQLGAHFGVICLIFVGSIPPSFLVAISHQHSGTEKPEHSPACLASSR